MMHILLIALVAASLVVAACGGDGDAESEASSVPTSGTTYFLAQSDRGLVTFALQPGSDRATNIIFGARGVRCATGRPITGMFVKEATAELADGSFAVKESTYPDGSSLVGRIADDRANGRFRMKTRQASDGAQTICDTGWQGWQAEAVPYVEWREARPVLSGPLSTP